MRIWRTSHETQTVHSQQLQRTSGDQSPLSQRHHWHHQSLLDQKRSTKDCVGEGKTANYQRSPGDLGSAETTRMKLGQLGAVIKK